MTRSSDGQRLDASVKTIGIFTYGFFDRWPRWANLFLDSCRYNPTVDFFLLTSCSPPRPRLPSNVKVVELDLPQFQALASERLGIAVNFAQPFKVIDFKPALGEIFESDVKDYDFWGYCDVDLVFGDIRTFLSDELLMEYDIVCTRVEFITGHFTLFRNVEELRRLYARSRDYQKVFGSAEIFNFDECGWGLHSKLLKGSSFAEVASEGKVDSLMHVIARTPDLRVHLKTICDEHLWGRAKHFVRKLRWEKGKLFDVAGNTDLMYYHFHDLKREPGFYVPNWQKAPEAFMITRRGAFWIGEQRLAERVATSVQRRISSYGKGTWAIYLFMRWKLRRLFRALRQGK